MAIHWNPKGELRQIGIDRGCTSKGPVIRSISLRSMSIGGINKAPRIYVADSIEKISAATDIINNRYEMKGYGSSHKIPVTRNHITFTADFDDEIVGTITLAIDSPEKLSADNTFHEEIEQLRSIGGVKLCELTKFAFKEKLNSKQLMAALFHIVYVYGHRTYGCSDLLIEVHPRHEKFYQSMLGFRRISQAKINKSVNAPLVLMHLEVAAIRANITERGGSGFAPCHSLYPLFFSPSDEDGIYQRLRLAVLPAVTGAPANENTRLNRKSISRNKKASHSHELPAQVG